MRQPGVQTGRRRPSLGAEPLDKRSRGRSSVLPLKQPPKLLTRMHPKLLVDAAHMGAHRTLGDKQFLSDDGRVLAVNHKLIDCRLPSRKSRELGHLQAGVHDLGRVPGHGGCPQTAKRLNYPVVLARNRGAC